MQGSNKHFVAVVAHPYAYHRDAADLLREAGRRHRGGFTFHFENGG